MPNAKRHKFYKSSQFYQSFLCFLLLSTAGMAQDAPALPAQTRPVPTEQWEKAAGTLDYSDEVPEDQPEQPQPQAPSLPRWNFEGLGVIMQVLAIVVLVALVGYGVYRMMQEPRNRQIARDGVEITLENIEEYLHETDLERFLRAALAEGNYPQAVRLYYLQAIKDLSAKNLIRWSKEKTNRAYVQELRGGALHEPFRAITRTFERIWYGNAGLTEAEFRTTEPELKNFLTKI